MERLAENKKRRESDKQARMESKTLGHLQVIIGAAITQNGGSAPFDYICNYAKKFATAFNLVWCVDRRQKYSYSSGTSGVSINPEVLADAIKVSLDEKSGVKFKRDPARSGNWILAEQSPVPFATKKDLKTPPQTKVLSSTRTVVVHPQPPARKGRPKKGSRNYSSDSSSEESAESSDSDEEENESEEGREWGEEGDDEDGSEGESEGVEEPRGRGVAATRGGRRGRGRGRGRAADVDSKR